MRINEQTLDGLTILDLSGKVTIGDGAQLLKDKSESLIFQRRTQVIVNLAAVPYIDSGGLGQLIACYTTLTKAGGRLTLVNVNTRNHDLAPEAVDVRPSRPLADDRRGGCGRFERARNARRLGGRPPAKPSRPQRASGSARGTIRYDSHEVIA